VRRFALFLALVSAASAAVAQADSEAQRAACEATATWVPVRMPEAGINAAIPCTDQELSAYKNANEERKRSDGMVGCERGGRTYIVMYFVNTPAGFFDQYWNASPAQSFQVAGHRVSRMAAIEGDEGKGRQLIEIDARRAVLMWSSSKVSNDPDFSKITSCFFNSFEFAPK